MTAAVISKGYQGLPKTIIQVVCLLLVFGGPAHAAEDIGIIYPLVREPYLRVFTEIIQGIREAYPGNVHLYPVNGDLSSLSVPADDYPDAFVALGSKSLELASDLKAPVYAVLTEESGGVRPAGTILLKASAETMLANLLAFHPSVGRVHTVFSDRDHGELIDGARSYLSGVDRELNALSAVNVRQSAKAFRRILESARPGDGIWLIPESGLVDASVLDLILHAAWEKRLAVFSSNPAFVKRGVLFAIYPDNVGVGRSMAAMVMADAGEGGDGRVRFMEDIKIAFNERTGNHIGVRLDPEHRARVDLILPEF